MNEHYNYPGQELAFFEKAVNWKTYFSSYINSFIGNNVLEVGSGIGATTRLLNGGSAKTWTLLEPDEEMNKILQRKKENQSQFSNCIIRNETVFQLSSLEKFDTIIYIDVLEHIKDDKKEMIRATELLQLNGHLIILSPAYNFLFSPFDKAIGHYRRYTTETLKSAMPVELKLIQVKYLDSIGFFASLANKLFLKQSYPSEKQIQAWDKLMIPVSKWMDKIFFHSFGKSILGIWRKEQI
jgi:2-polyprenyl-3-methyl-5-hydroxy-6-metoxy-1,4-benzoquinol methylase